MDWLDEERGKGLLWEESRLVEAALQAVFGDYLLQIGVWGPENLFLKSARTRQCYILADTLNPSASLVSSADCLAIASDSIDAVLLPHALETSADPHQLLREIDRVLRPEGHLIVLGCRDCSVQRRHRQKCRRVGTVTDEQVPHLVEHPDAVRRVQAGS